MHLKLLFPLVVPFIFLTSCQKNGHMSNDEINSIDTFLTQETDLGETKYGPVYPIHIIAYSNTIPQIAQFNEQYSYFSNHPLVGQVTQDRDDIVIVTNFLELIHEMIYDKGHRELITAEALSKILAYRNLSVGDQIRIPRIDKEGKRVFAGYFVEKVFDLYDEMPAFGLFSKDREFPPLLLFRGTDLSNTEAGRASFYADLDLDGPGYHIYMNARDDIKTWLEKVQAIHQKAQIMGYSLGASFVEYTAILEKDLLSDTYTSYAFNPPGVNDDLLKIWEDIPRIDRPNYTGYINKGDAVSNVGTLFGTIKELSLDHPMGPLEAHLTFMLAQNICYITDINPNFDMVVDD